MTLKSSSMAPLMPSIVPVVTMAIKGKKQSALKEAAGKHCLEEMWGRAAAPGAMSSLGSHLDTTGPLTNTEREAQSCLWAQPEPKSGAKTVLQLFPNFPKAPFPVDIVLSREQIIIKQGLLPEKNDRAQIHPTFPTCNSVRTVHFIGA